VNKHRIVSFPSPPQPWVNPGGGPLEFKQWVPSTDGQGNRYIIQGFEIYAQVVATTAGATSLAADLYRFFKAISLQEVDGTMRYNEVSGDALRMLCYQLLGAKRTREQFNVAVGAGQSFTVKAYVPLERPQTEDPYEFCLPVEAFQLLRIRQPVNSDFNLGAATVAITSINFQVTARCFVEPKDDLTAYARDIVQVNDFANAATTNQQINVGPNAKVHDCIMYLPGPGGGSAINTAQITQANIVGIYSQSQNLFPDLVDRYALDHDEEPGLFATTNQSPIHTNPFVPDPADGAGVNAATNPRAVALLSSTGNRPDEGPTVNQLTFQLTETAAPGVSPRIITRSVVPQSQGMVRAQQYANGRGKKQALVKRRDGRSVSPSHQQYYAKALR